MEANNTKIANYYKMDRKTIARLKESKVIKDIIFYDALVKYYLEQQTKEKNERLKKRLLRI